MCFFFGLAAQEITETFLPGGMMNPPTKKAINPVAATFGGVFGPVIVYFILLSIFDASGAFDDKSYGFEDLKDGWGIVTATDISLGWAAAIFVFGAGHPGVYYTLLMAVSYNLTVVGKGRCISPS